MYVFILWRQVRAYFERLGAFLGRYRLQWPPLHTSARSTCVQATDLDAARRNAQRAAERRRARSALLRTQAASTGTGSDRVEKDDVGEDEEDDDEAAAVAEAAAAAASAEGLTLAESTEDDQVCVRVGPFERPRILLVQVYIHF